MGGSQSSTRALYSTAQASPEIVNAIERAWDGVAVKLLVLTLDNRSRYSVDGEARSGRLGVTCTLSGAPDAIMRHGLLDADFLASMPPRRSRSGGGFYVHRGTRTLRINCHFIDPAPKARHPFDKHASRIWDRLATVVAPAIWQPARE